MLPTVIGPYTAGEIPPPLTVNFKKSDGTAIDFSTGGPWAAKFVYRIYGGVFVTRTCPAPTSATGAVTYIWVAGDFTTPGDVEAEMWVGNGANRYDSIPLAYQIRPAVAVPAPVI
jgi:hypothetical protein